MVSRLEVGRRNPGYVTTERGMCEWIIVNYCGEIEGQQNTKTTVLAFIVGRLIRPLPFLSA